MIDAVMLRDLLRPQVSYRERFMVAVGDKLKSINVSDIAYFFCAAGITFASMNSNNQYSLDFSLDNLKEMLNPKDFFRVNPQYFVGLKIHRKSSSISQKPSEIGVKPAHRHRIICQY